MHLLCCVRLPDSTERRCLDDNIVYRPDLETKPNNALAKTLTQWSPDVVLCRRPPETEVLRQWAEVAEGAPRCLIAFGGERGDEARLARLGISLHFVAEETDDISDRDEPEMRAIMLAERLITRHFTAADNRDILRAVRSRNTARAPSVTVVGAGVVNVLTAHYLQREGYVVTLVDAGPDPRSRPSWRKLGCTSGGDDARMFTLSEADDYHFQGDAVSEGMNDLFRRDVVARGWLTTSAECLGRDEERWVGDFENVPPWLARRYNRDIFAFNRESRSLWDRLIEMDPALFEHIEYRPDILRIYSNLDHYRSAVERQRRIGALRRVLSPSQVAAHHPGLAEAVAHGEIAGGIEVVGFTVNVHKMMARLLDGLEANGAHIHWNTRASRVLRNRAGHVRGIAATDHVITSDHYVLSPGVYGGELLQGLRSHGHIHGVLGLWLRIPNREPKIEHSLKVGRKGHMAEDSNITVATDEHGNEILIIGSGYGYTGIDPKNIDSALLDRLFEAVENTAARLFPRAHAEAVATGMLRNSRKFCVRPWTASCLGVFEMVQTERDGVLVVTGGHNTGGFAQAPAVANAVLCALRGRHHDMHEHYHPDRLAGFLRHVAGRGAFPSDVRIAGAR